MNPKPMSRRELRVAEKQAGSARRPSISTARWSVRGAVVGILLLAIPAILLSGSARADTTSVTINPGGSISGQPTASAANAQNTVVFNLSGRPSGGSLYLGVELRRARGALYRAKVQIGTDGTLSVGASKVQGGPEQILGNKRLAAIVGTGTSVVKLQGAVQGATLRVRVWLGSAAVPDWQIQVTDSSPITQSGVARAWGYLSTAANAPVQISYQELAGAVGGVVMPPSSLPAPIASPTSTPTSNQAASPTPSPIPTAPITSPATAPADLPPGGAISAGMAGVIAGAGAATTTNYVAPASAVLVDPNGNDANPGTATSPLRTIASAVAKAPAGGTIVLRGGIYRQAVGTVNKRLTIQAYPGEHPTLSGADVVSAWTAAGDAWRTSTWTSPFAQDQFRVDEVPAGSAAGLVEQVFRNGVSLHQVLTKGELKTGTFWLDPSSKYVYVADDPGVSTMELSTRARGMTLAAGAAGSKILGLRFTAYAAPHLDSSGELYVSSPGTLIENSTFDHSSGAGLKIAAANLTVHRITVRDNAAEGMQGNRNDNSVVEHSLFQGNNAEHFEISKCGAYCTIAGFKTAHTDGLKVLANAFINNDSNGFWCDLGCTNATVSGNAVSGSASGIYYEVSSRGTISGNYVQKSNKGIRISGSDHVTLSNNTLLDNVWQLTIYDDTRSPSSDAYSASKGLSWDTTNLVIEGNTFSGGTSTKMLLAAGATYQIASPQMYQQVSDNAVSGVQVMVWCSANNACKSYPDVSTWKSVSKLGF